MNVQNLVRVFGAQLVSCPHGHLSHSAHSREVMGMPAAFHTRGNPVMKEHVGAWWAQVQGTHAPVVGCTTVSPDLTQKRPFR